MADVIDSRNYTIGQILKGPKNICCDNHETKQAVVRIVVKIDFATVDVADLCPICYEEFIEESSNNTTNPDIDDPLNDVDDPEFDQFNSLNDDVEGIND